MSEKIIQTNVQNSNNFLPEDYDLICKIRDLWANNNDDLTIRGLLSLSMTRWKEIMKLIKELDALGRDNHVAFLKYSAKSQKRSKEIEELRQYATSNGEISAAVNMFKLEADIDKQLIDVGQKLGVLSGEVIRIENYVKNENSIEILFSEMPEEIRLNAENDLKLLTQKMIAAGVEFGETDAD